MIYVSNCSCYNYYPCDGSLRQDNYNYSDQQLKSTALKHMQHDEKNICDIFHII